MATFNIVCGGPGPHIPASGILGTCDRPPTADVRCSSASCVKPVDVTVTNQQTLQTALDLRLTQIESFVAANPTGATLTPAQTLVVAKMLIQLARLVRGALSTIGQGG